MMRSTVVAAMLLSFAFGTGAVLAQDTPPATSDKPAATSKMGTDKPPMSPEKKAISKTCTDKANAKWLHGDARKKFRSACKKAGGKID
jgi:hypothetical protein